MYSPGHRRLKGKNTNPSWKIPSRERTTNTNNTLTYLNCQIDPAAGYPTIPYIRPYFSTKSSILSSCHTNDTTTKTTAKTIPATARTVNKSVTTFHLAFSLALFLVTGINSPVPMPAQTEATAVYPPSQARPWMTRHRTSRPASAAPMVDVIMSMGRPCFQASMQSRRATQKHSAETPKPGERS